MSGQSPRAASNSGQPPSETRSEQTTNTAIQPGIPELFAAGLVHHQAGRLAEAEVHYRRTLDAVPDHADALHLLGGLAYQTGRHEAAIELIGRAIEHNNGNPSYHCSYGLVLQGLNRFDESIASYDRALVISPDYIAALINRGLALQGLECFADALESYDRDSPSNRILPKLASTAATRFSSSAVSAKRCGVMTGLSPSGPG